MNDQTSPDGTILVAYDASEVRMSHWIFRPRVVHIPKNEILLDLWGADFWKWDAHARFEEPGAVILDLRCYPGTQPGFSVRIHVESRTFTIIEGTCPDDLLARLQSSLRQAGAATP